MQQQVAIKGMTCGGCTQTVEKALKQVAGVKTATVSLVPPQAVIQTDHEISNAQLQSRIHEILHVIECPTLYKNMAQSENSTVDTEKYGDCLLYPHILQAVSEKV